MKPLADQAARDAIANDLDATLVVEAAAGTGKTTALVGRVLNLLRSGKGRLKSLVAVTFTEKAAGEMKLRLRSEIEKARQSEATTDEERRRFEAALEELEATHIGTIHGFCADLLRERPVEAEVDPLFEVASEETKERLFDESFEPWFQAELAKKSEGVRRVLRRRSRDRDAAGPREALRSAGLALVEQRDFSAPWRREPFDREASLDAVLRRLGELGDMWPKAEIKDDWFVKSLLEIHRFMQELARRERVHGERDHDGLEGLLRELERKRIWGWKGRIRWVNPGVDRKDALALRASVKEELSQVLDACDADLAACLSRELREVVSGYETLKRRAGRLDFLDLLLKTRDMLRDRPAVRAELQKRYDHLLVDEFQDTDPLQAEILLLLAADDPRERDAERVHVLPGKLFVVGDPKQSIYRFRRADVALYERVKRRLVNDGARLVHLSTSFRSAPSIQEAINAAFSERMQGNVDGSQAEYVPLSPFREEPKLASGEPRPAVIALPVPRPYSAFSDGGARITNYKIDESLPDAVGAFVDWLITKSGWTVTERERPGVAVPIEPRHVCLLFKRFQAYRSDATRPYVRALEARRIPHVLVGGRSYHAREEVVALRNAVAAVEWPDDELSVFATLRGPFFALGDDALLGYRHRAGALAPFRRIAEAELTELTRPVDAALEILATLHRRRNRRPIADTVARLLEATRAHAGVANWPAGEQALANVFRVLDLARRFEAQGAISFRAFAQRLIDDAERGGAAEAPVVEEGTDGVRMMTVHRAKGLEFPIVILVDPTAPSKPQNPSRYVDASLGLWAMPLAGCCPMELAANREEVLRHDAEEAVRLAYVAATRARELLVVPVCGDQTIEGWLDVLAPVVTPPDERRRVSSPVPGAPPFGPDSVFERPPGARGVEASVAPGLHRPERGAHHVVVWDPHALDLDREHDVGLRQQRILAADDGGNAAEGERQHAAWKSRRAEARRTGSVPSVVVRTPTEEKEAEGPAPTEGEVVPLETTDAPREGRPRGKRFGSLVHAILAVAPLDADAEGIARVASTQGRLVGAPKDEVEAACHAVRATLAHTLLARARSAGVDARREAPVTLRLAEGELLEGVVDLVFREADAAGPVWTVVDFKTDGEVASRRPAYERQVAWYVRAIAAATGERARGVLLAV